MSLEKTPYCYLDILPIGLILF